MNFLPGIITIVILALGVGFFIWLKTNPKLEAQIAKWKAQTAAVWGVAVPVLDRVAEVVEDLDGKSEFGNEQKLNLAAAAVRTLAPHVDAVTARRVAQAAHLYLRARQEQLL